MSSNGDWRGPQYGPGPGGGAPWGYAVQAPRPGVVPLQPLGIGEIISGVFATLQRYPAALFVPVLWTAFGSLAAFGVMAVVAVQVLDGPWEAVRADRTPTTAELLTVVSTAAAALLLFTVALTALYAVSSATATVVLRSAVIGRKASARAVWAESKPLLWRVTVAQILTGLLAAAVMLVPLLPAALLGLFLGAGPALAAGLLFAVPGWAGAVYIQVRLVLEIPVLVLENTRPVAALRRAWRLNEGNWWRSLGIPYVVGLIGSFAAQIVLVPFMVGGMLVMVSSTDSATADPYGPGAPPPVAGLVTLFFCLAVGTVLATALTVPLTPLTNGLLYIDRRIRRESLDIALAEAAGLRGGPAAHVPGQPGAPAAETAAGEPSAPAPGTETETGTGTEPGTANPETPEG